MEKIALILIISILGYLLITNVMVKYLRMKKEKNKKYKKVLNYSMMHLMMY